MQDIITVNHLSKSYGSHQVLNDISFSFQPGQIIALLGPNGSGKSSLIKYSQDSSTTTPERCS